MGSSRTRYDKIQRERSRRERATAKRERRLDKDQPGTDAEGAATTAPAGMSQADIMDKLAEVHSEYENEAISFEEFEQRKAELLALMMVD
jgi:hypothetical protein